MAIIPVIRQRIALIRGGVRQMTGSGPLKGRFARPSLEPIEVRHPDRLLVYGKDAHGNEHKADVAPRFQIYYRLAVHAPLDQVLVDGIIAAAPLELEFEENESRADGEIKTKTEYLTVSEDSYKEWCAALPPTPKRPR